MLLKKYSYLLLAGALATFSVSCDEEDDTLGDTEKPTVELSSPTADQLSAGFEMGSSFMVMGTVSDNRDLQTVTLMIEGPDGGTAWYDETWEEEDYDGDDLELDETIMIPANAPAGMHTMTLTAMDDAENMLTKTWEIEVMMSEQNAVTYTITIPEAVTEDIYIAGEFMNADGTEATWAEPGSNPEMKLTMVDDLTYTITLPVMDATGPDGTPDEMIEYKYVLGTGWDNEEVAIADCVSSNRSMALPLATMEADDVVEAWKLTCTP